jgi:subtilisin family serine protease
MASVFAAQASADSTEGRYIVVLKDSVKHPGAVAEDQADETGGDVSLIYRSALKGYAATLPKDEVETLEEDPSVDYVTPDRKVETLSQTIPTGVERIGADSNPSFQINGVDDLRVDADVAVIDTGIDYTHPDLNVVARTNCVPANEGETKASSCVDNSGTDGFGHGTHVAGTIGALDNGIGVVGVAPGVRLWAVRALNNYGGGYESWIVAGVDWVTAHASQIEVANMSLGCGCELPALEKAISASVNAGVVYAVSAGNESENAKYISPAKNPDVITVSALADYDGKPGAEAEPTCNYDGADDSLASFSNYGAGVDVAAPGVCILSTAPTGGSVLFPESETGYGTLSGTSMAAPHVAGAAAVLAEKSNPNSKSDVEAIRQTIVNAGSSGWTDTSGDGVKEPLLDVSNEGVFNPTIPKPTVKTEAPWKVVRLGAYMRGTVNPNGFATTFNIEYGTTTSYGSIAPGPGWLIAHELGSGTSDIPITEWVGGLAPDTTYHYRMAATNAGGTSYGEDTEFTTSATAFEGMVHLNSPYLGAIDCAMYGLIELNEGALDGGTLTELGFRACGSGTFYLQNCGLEVAYEGGEVSGDVETSTASIDGLHLTMTYRGPTCYADNLHWHLTGSIGGEFFEGEEESELVVDGSSLLYEDWQMFGTSMAMSGTLYIEGPPKLVP